MKQHSLKQLNAYVLALTIGTGFLLRWWGIRQDLPYTYYGDENYLIYNVLKFGTGDLNPHWFIWPTFFQYILFFLFVIAYLLGVLQGNFKAPADFLQLYLNNPSFFFLIGRYVAVVCGSASIYLIYRIAKKSYLENNAVALAAAALYALFPLAVEYSHYAVVDTPLVCMILLAVLFIINIGSNPSLRQYLLAGFLIGLAIGTKYSAVFLVFPLFIAHLFSPARKAVFDKRITLSFLFIIFGFLCACPFSLLDFPKFFADIHSQLIAARIGWFGWEKTHPHFYHFQINLRSGMGTLPWLFSLPAILYALKKRTRVDYLIFVFISAYFLCIGWGKNTYSRFMLPLLPFLAILSARLLFDIKELLCKRYRLRAPLFLLLAAPLFINPLVMSMQLDTNFYLPHTLTLAKKWVESNIPEGAKILLNEYSPPLTQAPYLIEQQAREKPSGQLRYGYHKKRDLFYQLKEKIAANRITYELSYINEPIGYLEGEPGYEHALLKSQEAIKDFQKKYAYVIISDIGLDKILKYPKKAIPQRYWVLRDFYEDITRHYQPIKVFNPEKGIRRGPAVKIYKL